jgi:hypothetical protein
MKSVIKQKSKLYFVYINTNENIASLCVKISFCRKILVWLTFLYFQNQLMCVCSRLGIVMCSVESIILVWNFEFTKKNYMWKIASELVVKYYTMGYPTYDRIQ